MDLSWVGIILKTAGVAITGGWLAATGLGCYVIVVLKRADAVQDSRVKDLQQMLLRYEDLCNKTADALSSCKLKDQGNHNG